MCVCVCVCAARSCFSRVQLTVYWLEKTVRHNDIPGESFVCQNQVLCVIYTQLCIIRNTAFILFTYSFIIYFVSVLYFFCCQTYLTKYCHFAGIVKCSESLIPFSLGYGSVEKCFIIVIIITVHVRLR